MDSEDNSTVPDVVSSSTSNILDDTNTSTDSPTVSNDSLAQQEGEEESAAVVANGLVAANSLPNPKNLTPLQPVQPSEPPKVRSPTRPDKSRSRTPSPAKKQNGDGNVTSTNNNTTTTTAQPKQQLPTGPANMLQIVNENKEFTNNLGEYMKSKWALADRGFDYNLVAVFGSQSTGKSMFIVVIIGIIWL